MSLPFFVCFYGLQSLTAAGLMPKAANLSSNSKIKGG